MLQRWVSDSKIDSSLILSFNSLLENYSNKNLRFVDTLLDEIIEKNQWLSASGDTVSALAKKHFKSIQAEQLQFLVRIKKLIIFIQKHAVLAALYTDAIYNIIHSDDHDGNYSLNHFKKALIKADICFWKPGDYHCVCCLGTKHSSGIFQSYTQKTHNDTILEQIFAGKYKKVLKNLLKNNKKKNLLIDVLLKLRDFSLKSTVYIYKEYSELPSLLNLSEVVLEENTTQHKLFVDFLENIIGKLYTAIIDGIIYQERFDCLEIACINPKYDYYEHVRNFKLSSLKKIKEEKRAARKESTLIELPAKKSFRAMKNKDSIQGNKNTFFNGHHFSSLEENKGITSREENPSIVPESQNKAAVIGLTENLSTKTTQLKKLFDRISKTLEYHRDSAESWIKKIFKIIENVQCSLHGTPDCNICLNILDEKKFNRFKSYVEERAAKIKSLKSSFEVFYCCVSNTLHEENANYIMTYDINKNEENQVLLEKIKLTEEKIMLSQRNLDSFISCCSEIHKLYEETVPHCCEFHRSWMRLLELARKTQHNALVSYSKKEPISISIKPVEAAKMELPTSQKEPASSCCNIHKDFTLVHESKIKQTPNSSNSKQTTLNEDLSVNQEEFFRPLSAYLPFFLINELNLDVKYRIPEMEPDFEDIQPKNLQKWTI